MASDKRELLLRVKVDDDASRPLKNIGDAADDTKDDLTGMNLGLKKLDGQVAETTKTIGDLRAEIAKTGDLELVKDLSKQEARLKQFARQRKSLLGDGGLGLPDFGKAGEDGAGKFAVSFMQRLGPLMAKSPIPAPLIAAFAAPAAIGLSATISGAVVGGVGIGGVIGGLAIASKHADVQKSARLTGDTFTEVMQRSAISFVPATVRALGDVRSEILGMEDDFEDVFASASRYVKPLTAGVTGFAKNLMPGVKDAVDQAGPIIDEVSSWGPRLGSTLSGIFSDFSDNATEGSRALATFFTVADYGLKTVGFLGNALTETYGFIDRGTAMLQGNTAVMAKYAAEEIRAREGSDDFAGGLENLLNKLDGFGQKTEIAAEKNLKLLGSLNGLTNAAAGSRAATMDFEAGLDELTASVARNGTTLDVGSAKGRANLQVVEGLIGASDRAGRAAEDRALAEGKSADVAAAAGAKMRGTFIADLEAAARKAGLSKSRIAEMVAELKRADGQRARMVVETFFLQTGKPATEFGGIGGQHYKGYADGGPISLRGPKGVDSGLIAAAPGEHMWTADEVDAAGGHAAVEAMRRSVRSGHRGAGGGGGWSGGGGGTVRLEVTLRWPDGTVAGQIVREGFRAPGGAAIDGMLRGIKSAGGSARALGIGGRW